MELALETLAAAAAAGLITLTLAPRIAASTPLVARNYRGLEVPNAVGIVVVLAISAGLAAATALDHLGSADEPLIGLTVTGLAAALGFGLLGLWDDVAGGSERGWGTHLRSLAAGRPTSGGLKLAGGALIGLVVGFAFGGTLLGVLMRGAIVALAANLVNLLDLRPGRAVKFSLILLAGPFLAAMWMGDPALVPLAATLAAGVAFLPLDLAERGMLGDVGANPIGAVGAIGFIAVASPVVQGVVLVVLIGIHTVADRPGLSSIIRSTPALARLDALGRVDPGR